MSAQDHNAKIIVDIGGNYSRLQGHPVVSGVLPEVSVLVLIELRKQGLSTQKGGTLITRSRP